MKRKPKPPEKFIAYHDLVAAMKESGCAICRRMETASENAIESLLYESVNDPQFREQMRRSHGFCREHARMALATGDALGLSILYEDLLSQSLDSLRQGETRLDGTKSICPICHLAGETELRTLKLCSEFWQDSSFAAALQTADAFCQRHFASLQALLPRGLPRQQLRQWEMQKLAVLSQQLGEFIRKADYRFQAEPLTSPEKNAYRRAMAWFVGRVNSRLV